MTDDTLIYSGGEVKALGSGRVGGYLVRFGTPETADVQGDFFTPETDFAIKAGRPVDLYYRHGLRMRTDPLTHEIGNDSVGEGEVKSLPDGLWIEGQLDLSRPAVARMYERHVAAGTAGWSSGSVDRLTRREAVKPGVSRVVRWPIVEATISPKPVDPRNRVIAVKDLTDGEVASPSLLERLTTLVADAGEVRALVDRAIKARDAEGRTLSDDKRAAIKALAESLAELDRHLSRSRRPDAETIRRFRLSLERAAL